MVQQNIKMSRIPHCSRRGTTPSKTFVSELILNGRVLTKEWAFQKSEQEAAKKL